MTRATAITAFSLLACLAISAAAFAASPAASPNVLPAESMGVTQAPPPQPINWDRVTQEATDLLSKYIQINTTNPPGNEIEAARMLKEKFLSDGVPATTWEPQHGRGIVAARLRGIGKHNKSIILLSHMDVVPADPKEWQVPPFAGLVKNGQIWGRGAIDDKGPGVIELMAMLAIKRAGILLNRDVLFIATATRKKAERMARDGSSITRPAFSPMPATCSTKGAGFTRWPTTSARSTWSRSRRRLRYGSGSQQTDRPGTRPIRRQRPRSRGWCGRWIN